VLGWQEVIIIFSLLLFIFGPSELPKIARELGKAVREFQKATSSITGEINQMSSSLTEAVRPSSRKTTKSSFRATDVKKRDKALSEIDKTLNIDTEEITNEQIVQIINEKTRKKIKKPPT